MDSVVQSNAMTYGNKLRIITKKNFYARILFYGLLSAIAFVTTAPFVIMLSVSLTPNYSFLVLPIELIPKDIGLQNYVALFNGTQAARWLWNSTIVTVIGTLCMLLTSSMAGYAFNRGNFIGKQVIFIMFLGILMVPVTVSIVPLFILLSRLGWTNTYWALIGPWSASAFGVFFLRQHYAAIPRDYDDAALMDGASKFLIYWRVLLPQIKPGLIILGTLRFMQHWNDFLYPLMVAPNHEMRTITVGLATLQRSEGAAGFEMAGAVVAFLPTLIIFVIAQQYIIEGASLSGVKG